MIKRFGKNLEAMGRKIRTRLFPSYRRAFTALLARGLSQHREGEPIVCCDFANPAIDAVGGRYYFSLVRDLIDAGYFPVFTARRETLSTFGTSRMKSLLLTERLGVIRSLDELREPYYLITDNADGTPKNSERIVVVNYAWRVCCYADEIAFPFFVHPSITPFPRPATQKTTARLFFGGNTMPGKYDKAIIRDTYGMLSRREMLAIAAAAIPADQIHKPSDADEWLTSTDFHSYVICETQNCKIPPARWLEALAKADFFLACPGVGMPLCHNVIEAMAAGAVPILQYADYLSPPLQHGVNCLTFHDAQSLSDVLNSVFSMTEEERIPLRRGVQAYYQQHLAPGCFTHHLFDGPSARSLLFNAYRVPR